MFSKLIVLTIVTLVMGCVAQGAHQLPQESIYSLEKFNAPLGSKLSVETGNSIFVEGEYIKGEHIEISEPIDKMIPGSMMIPFPVHIDPGSLKMTRITPSWKYYCADIDKAAASFPGLGSVIRDGDCVGIRISIDGSDREWVVDNSNYNRGWGTTIYSKNMSQEEIAKYKPNPSKKPFKIKNIKRIVFDGYYGGQVHFSWENISYNKDEEKEFTFDFTNRPTLVGIKGNQFIVHSVDNVQLVYEWKKINR